VLRLIDANLDRIREGLRVLSEIARFLLEDAALTDQLKTLRHELTGESLPLELLSARQADRDVTAFTKAPGEGQRQDLPTLAIANARRIQESLRVLEEFAKLPSAPPTFNWTKFQQARFAVYDLEKRLVSGLLRRDKAARLAGLHVIIDTERLRGHHAVEVTRQIAGSGATVIQLRDKGGANARLLGLTQELQGVCAENGMLFIINDYLDLALAAETDGLHLEQNDLPISEARRLLKIDKLIGCSASTPAEAQQAWQDGADYIRVSAIYPTPSKENVRLAGLDALQHIKQVVPLTAIAMGGINQANVEKVIAAGADGVAVGRAVLEAENPEMAARQLVTSIEQTKSSR